MMNLVEFILPPDPIVGIKITKEALDRRIKNADPNITELEVNFIEGVAENWGNS